MVSAHRNESLSYCFFSLNYKSLVLVVWRVDIDSKVEQNGVGFFHSQRSKPTAQGTIYSVVSGPQAVSVAYNCHCDT